MKKQFITETEYERVLEPVNYCVQNVEDAIKVFDYLKDKTTEIEDMGCKVILENLHLKFLSNILCSSFSPRACSFTEAEEEFLKSDYLSKELKEEIYNKIENGSSELIELLKSETQINDFSKKSIKEIMELLNSGRKISSNKEIDEFFHIFEEYLFALDGNGPIEYLKEKYGYNLPIEMLKRSNVIDESSYYSGYGVDHNLLGDMHLFSLYKKFVKYYPEKVDEFVKFVNSITLLRPVNFINNYFSFVSNGLNCVSESKEANFSVEGLYGSTRDLVGTLSIFSSISNNSNIRWELEAQNSIIERFLEEIKNFKKLQEAKQTKGNDKVRVIDRKKQNR